MDALFVRKKPTPWSPSQWLHAKTQFVVHEMSWNAQIQTGDRDEPTIKRNLTDLNDICYLCITRLEWGWTKDEAVFSETRIKIGHRGLR